MPNSRFTTAERVRENRLRRVADRRGLALARSRRRDQGANDYGLYSLTDKASGEVVVQGLPFEAVELVLGAVERREYTLTAEQMQVVLESVSGRLQASDPAANRFLAGQVLDPAVGTGEFLVTVVHSDHTTTDDFPTKRQAEAYAKSCRADDRVLSVRVERVGQQASEVAADAHGG